EVHPDADTLTALTEQLLPVAERQQVLAHLAACGQCREVFALSQPQLPELVPQPVFKPAPVSGWRKLFTPTFGLAGAAAAMAIVALVVSQNSQRSFQQQPKPEAKVTQPAEAAASKTQDSAGIPASRPEAVQPALDKNESAAERARRDVPQSRAAGAASPARTAQPNATAANAPMNRGVLGHQADAVANQPVLSADLRKKDYVNPGIIFAANATDNFGNSNGALPSAPQPKASASETRLSASVPPQITIFQDIPTNTASNKNNIRIMTPPQPPEHSSCPPCKVVEKGARAAWRRLPGAVPAINGNSLTFSAMGGQKFSGQLQKEQPSELAAAPANSTGVDGLQRFEALSGRAMAGADTSSADSSAVAWKVMGGKLVKSRGPAQWEDAYPGASFQFLVVSSRGNDVWAGGTHASIIHSRDGGANWEAPKLGDEASGSVVSILFSGSIVQVRTSEGQSWSSSDGGKTWTQN
ncbi:MAG TPA: YCF48-related protein, partial [Candidatus Angelobacter sp.]